MIRVCVESPFRGDVPLNVRYADACMIDCLQRGEAPYFGHLLYTRVLDDSNPMHREWGIGAHCAWLQSAERVAAYIDLDMTAGMIKAITLAQQCEIPVEYRRLGAQWDLLLLRARRTPGFI